MIPHHSQRLRAAPGRRGTSLVELMFAAVVLVVGISAAALQSARAHELRRHTDERLTATAHLRSVMTTILERDPADLLRADSEWAAGEVDVSANLVLCLPEQRTTVEYPGYAAGDPAPSLLPVVVRVAWEPGRGETQTLELCSAVKR